MSIQMNLKNIISKHKSSAAIILFVVLLFIIHTLKPSLIYNTDGSFRSFGVGYKNKTVVPIWLVSICLAILSYLAVSYYIMML
jgi:hypothetical protein